MPAKDARKNNEVVVDTSALATEECKLGLNAVPSARAELTLVERRQRERRKAKRPAAASALVVSYPVNLLNGGVVSSNLPTCLGEAISAMDREGTTLPSVEGLDRAAYFGCNDRSFTGDDSHLITVLIASSRENLLKKLLPWLASEQGIKVLGEPIADPLLLPMYLEQWQPTLLLLDKALLDRLGSESLRMIRPKVRKVRVLLLWDEFCPGLVEDILRNRFHGHLLTSCSSDTYVKAIRAVCRGDIWLPRGLLAQALSNLLETPSPGDAKTESNRVCGSDVLTKREEQIVRLLSQGLTNKQMARHLGIMEDTVKKHLQNVFGKLGVRRRTLVVLRQLAGQPDSA
ncbi:MAG: response regulator transcription factor [Gammaproteobacteria bacterium]